MLAAVAALGLGGCRAIDDRPLIGGAFKLGFVLGAAPPAIACLPLTLPAAAADGSCRGMEGLLWLALPGLPTGFLAGSALVAPAAVVDLLLVRPAEAVGDVLRARRRAWPGPPPVAVPAPGAALPPAPDARAYEGWPAPEYAPRPAAPGAEPEGAGACAGCGAPRRLEWAVCPACARPAR